MQKKYQLFKSEEQWELTKNKIIMSLTKESLWMKILTIAGGIASIVGVVIALFADQNKAIIIVTVVLINKLLFIFLMKSSCSHSSLLFFTKILVEIHKLIHTIVDSIAINKHKYIIHFCFFD